MPHIHKPLYRFVLRDALRISWNHKLLWFFGFFVSLLGSGGTYEIIIRGLDRALIKSLLDGGAVPNAFSIFQKLKTLFLLSPTLGSILKFVLVTGGFVLIFALYIFVASAATAMLIRSAKKFFRGGSVKPFELILEEKKSFFKVSVINLLAKLLISLFIIMSALPLGWSLAKSSASFGLLYIAGFVILVSLGLIVSFLAIYSACFAVLENKQLIEAIRGALRLFKANAIISLEMAVVLFLINLGASLLLATILIAFVGLMGFLLAIFAIANLSILFWIVAVITAFVFGFAIIILGSFLGAFQLVSWTILFSKLVKGEAVSKLLRLASRVPRLIRPWAG